MKKYPAILGFIIGAFIGTLLAVLNNFSILVGFSTGASIGLIVGSIVSIYMYQKSKEK